ncbi:penicillin-binding protein [Streptomyces mashuensis]|uniref:Penicillin-binding protein n=1 Tax=Streptomyces mashuensis TaxID=33904 RepID=A0A919B820_9ACTN|nr:transglycosylase domain-containing protein [Streptomyces mashuensis]GHF60806.1 penicillin-binding protein [Streptomyces mashuensis]
MGRAEARKAQKKGTGPDRGGKPKKKGIRRFFTWKLLLAYFVAVVGLGVGAFYALYLYVDVPTGNSAATLQSNVYKTSDGKTIARIGEVNREEVPLSKVPEDVRKAVVAAENKNFYNDSGVDLKGTTRGIVNTVLGHGKQGGSTITQQYVKNYYLDQRQTVTRKVKELIITLKVNERMTKDDILQGYLNTSYYGRGAYGIQAASRAYYNKDVDKLTLEEGAYLAALLQAPSQYDWGTATEAGKKNALSRWNYVLDKMVEQNWLDAGKRKTMTFKEPGQPKPALGLTGQNGYLIEAAKREIIRDLEKQGRKESDFAAGGWTITLSIDSKKQKALEKAVQDKLISDLEPGSREVDKHVQAGAVSVDPKTGKVVALYGGQDFAKHQISNATRGDYQPASTFKPLILASALENDSRTQDHQPIKPGTLYDGTNKRPVVGSDIPFAPENEDGYSKPSVTVQQAMNDSVNTVFAQMAVDVGLEKVKKTATDLGMKGDFDATPAMSLGSMGASPMEMAGVYATLNNHGKKVTPSIVKSATQRGQNFDLPNAVGDRVVSRDTADGMTSVLTGVVDDGTANVVASSAYQVAGKTGTSDDDKSAWFSGYTPGLVTSVGLFGEGPGGKQVTLQGTGGNGRVNGGTYPAKIWAAYTSAVYGSGDDDDAKFDLDTNVGFVPPQAPAGTPAAQPSSTQGRSPSPTASKGTQSPSPNASQRSHTPDPGPTSTRNTGKPTPPTVPPTRPTPTGGGTDGGTRPDGGRNQANLQP